MDQSNEKWLPVVGQEGRYEVSDLGRVRSLDRYSRAGNNPSRFYRGAMLKIVNNPTSRRSQVTLYKDGKETTKLVHRLVLEAFVGPAPDGTEGCHNDGDTSNNRLANLRWDSHLSNEADKKRHGTHNNTAKTHCPQGHALEEPNLVPAEAARGHRKCRACNRARAWAYNRGLPFDIAVADDRFRRIMS